MFYTGGLDGLETVVLDECHYMGDEGRGTVWEEIIVNCPRTWRWWRCPRPSRTSTRSPTGSRSSTGPIVAITHPHRPVPLSSTWSPISRARSTPTRPCAAARCACSGEERDGGRSDRGRWYTRRVVDPTVMLDELEARGWLPAIYFIFSRAGCERAMETVLAEGKPLLTRDAAAPGGGGHPRGHHRQPDHRGVAAQPDHLPGARHGRGAAPRGRSCRA